MRALQYEASMPTMPAEIDEQRAHINRTGSLPEGECGLQVKMCYVLYLLKHRRNTDAAMLIDTLNYSPDIDMPLIGKAWLWLARMSIYIAKKDFTLAIGAAEQSLQALDAIAVKRGEDFLAILAAILYNLASIHNSTGENVRAAKELSKAQKLYERLVKKNEHRFASMLTYAVEASTVIFSSRTKQMEVFSHYQELSEQYSALASEGNREALRSLMETLTKEADLMMQMGNSRDAAKYYSKALRCHKRLGAPMDKDGLHLSIALARALMQKSDRRDTAEQLLLTLQPVAQNLGAKDAAKEIEDLLKAKNRNLSIMSLLKGIF